MNAIHVLAQASNLPFLQMGWGGGHVGGWGWGAWLLMSIFMVLFWGTVVAVGIWFVRAMPGHDRDRR